MHTHGMTHAPKPSQECKLQKQQQRDSGRADQLCRHHEQERETHSTSKHTKAPETNTKHKHKRNHTGVAQKERRQRAVPQV